MPRRDAPAAAPVSGPRHRAVYIAIAVSGFTALGAEVVWTRLLSLLPGRSVYTFSLIPRVQAAGRCSNTSASCPSSTL